MHKTIYLEPDFHGFCTKKPDGWWNAFCSKKKKGGAKLNGVRANLLVTDLKGRK